MESRENPASAGVHFECFIDGHFGRKLDLIHLFHSFARTHASPHQVAAEYAYKPDSVPTRVGDDHLSGAFVTERLGAT